MQVPVRATSAAFAVAAAVTLAAAGAWACVPGGGASGKKLTMTPAQVRPGDQFTVSAPSSAVASPIDIRLHAADGPLLGSISSAVASLGASSIDATFTLPLETRPGHHALIAVQAGQRWEPAALAVALPDGTVPDTVHSATETVTQSGSERSTAFWAITGLAVLGLGALAVRFLFASRRDQGMASPAIHEPAGSADPVQSG